MDCKSHSSKGRHQQESVGIMPELCTAVPDGVAAASPTSYPLKSTGQLLKTLGVGSSMCSFLPTCGAARASLNHPQRYEGSSRDTKNSHTDSLHPAVSKKPPLCHSESDFCFVEACDDGGDLTGGKSWLPVSSGRSAKSNFVNKVVGAFRNISQRSTTWINPDYLVAATSKSSHLGQNLLPPQCQRKNFNLMEPQVGVGCEVNNSQSFFPPKSVPNWHPASCGGTVDYSCSGPAAAPQPAWQNSDVLGSQSNEFLFWDMSHPKFLLEQQQQYLYYEKLQSKKSPSTCSDNSYGSGLDDSWNVVSARDCGQTNYSDSVNGNTAPPGVFNGLMQLAVPSISCVNVTTASQLFSCGMSQRIPSPSFSTHYSSGISEFYRGTFQNEENYRAATHEFSINEAPEAEVDDGQVTSRNFSPYFGCFTVTPETSEIVAASDPQNFLTLNQSNNLSSVKSSLNPNAKEWNGWVSCSKLNPEAKEWVPQTVENVQSTEISTDESDLVYANGNEKIEEGEKQFEKETFSLLAELEIENDSGLAKCAEDRINVDTISDQSTESSCLAISTSDDDVHSSCLECDTCESVHESGMCVPEVLKHDNVPKEPLQNLSESSESFSLSWDSVETCDSPKLNECELAELYLSCDKVDSKSPDEAILKSGENAESSHRSGASPKKSSCMLLEKLRNLSFTPCKENNQDEEYDDACEFIIFADGDCEDPGESAENYPCADNYSSDESDISDSDSDSENEDEISLASDESFDEIEVSSADDRVKVHVTPPSPEPSQVNGFSFPKCTSVNPFWRDLKQEQQQEQGAYADLSDDDWDWHSESKSGSISATCWAFEQGLMTLKTPINTLSKRLGYVEKERKKSLTEVEKANLKWDTEIDDNVRGNSGQRVQFDDNVSFYDVEKDIERKGEWEQIARDNARFRSRIQNLSAVLSPVLEKSYRNVVYQARFSRSSAEEEISACDR